MTRDPRKIPDAEIASLVATALPEWKLITSKILSRSLVVGECWEWQGAKNSAGYGHIQVKPRPDKKLEYTHRAMLIGQGRNLQELEACHRCDNPCCVRPDHLFAGTRRDNVLDSVAKGRAKNPPSRTDWPQVVQAGKHHWQRLSTADILAIRERLNNGESRTSVAENFGISIAHASAIALRKRWGHL